MYIYLFIFHDLTGNTLIPVLDAAFLAGLVIQNRKILTTFMMR